MAGDRSSLGLTIPAASAVPKPCPVSEPRFFAKYLVPKPEPDTNGFALLGSSMAHKHGEPYALGSKDARNIKIHCLKGKSIGISKNYLGREARNYKLLKLEPNQSLDKQLEIQQKVVEDHHKSLRGKEKASPNLNISPQMKARYGKQALEIYNTTSLLPRTHFTHEDVADHGLMQQAVAVMHNRSDLKEKMMQTMREKEEIQKRVQALEHQVSSFKDWSEKAEVALLKSRVEIRALEKRCIDSFNAGRSVGRMELASEWQREDKMKALRP